MGEYQGGLRKGDAGSKGKAEFEEVENVIYLGHE